ncbi:lipopolysaccharide biosynthesis protein [Lacticaseibacillus paracasei]|jgi:O-antigen/teichoic acid export membrane protein|uniref:lipopolysaccharide biosynthesis protein n=1 Tax=Lacticaseibacillus paracasei TaxID=1597 RepID=UPI0002983EAC|nr:oligosaccharide flippase family protein [Lacticaseibacillus paracasei]EPC94393.1 polysaccharide biosynthesis protein [Lacticaseibacillus paracasei subsp. paracasei CNCM I-4648]AWR91859.1 hypothetical protein DMC16_12395 [Lacticaseibacillus paracasei]EKQ09005.1 hypothetical protein LCAM36_1492 [Lacticaseibacillus paracasei]MDM7549268.1 oligosaccharide flippase family protein [Lacticaseibacillus paracasei]RNE28584.1 putative membrane protein EpsK [Lacticaseibacillus paracasei]
MLNQRRAGVVLSYINMIAKNLVNFIYVPILIRMLGKSEYGLYQMSNSVISTLGILSLGFGSAYIRFYAQAKRQSEKEVDRLNGLYLIIFSVAGVLSLIAGVFLVANVHAIFSQSLTLNEIKVSRILMALMILNIAISFISSVFDSFIMANEQFRFQRSRQLLQTFLAPILTIPLVFFGFKAISVVLIQSLITIFFLFLNINFAVGQLHMRFSFKNMSLKYFTEIGIFSVYILANDITDQINWNAPNILLGMLSGTKSVAIFGVASQVKNVFINLSTTLSGVFVPQINKIVANDDNNQLLTDIMTKVGRIQALIVLYVFGGFIVVGKYFVNIWAGKGYDEVYVISILLIVPLLIPLVQSVGIEIQRAKNRHKFRSYIYILFAVINLFLTYWLIGEIGIIGAAAGGLITMLISNGIIMNWYYSSHIGLNMKFFWKEIFKLMPQFIIPTVILYLLSITWRIDSFAKFLFYGLVYSLMYFLIYFFWGINSREKQWITQAFKNR